MENEEPKVEQPAEPQKAEENVQPTNAPVKKTGRGKEILLVIGGIILLLIIFGTRGRNKSQQTSPVATPTPAPVAMQITAKQLADDFDANQVAAEANWEGKLVEFNAEITNITDTGISFGNIASKQSSLTQISCAVTDKEQLMSLKNGQMITVQGVVGKQSIGVIDVSNCKVIK